MLENEEQRRTRKKEEGEEKEDEKEVKEMRPKSTKETVEKNSKPAWKDFFNQLLSIDVFCHFFYKYMFVLLCRCDGGHDLDNRHGFFLATML